MHLGHVDGTASDCGRESCGSAELILPCPCGEDVASGVDISPGEFLLVAAAIVAFKIVANGGFIPHARHGGIGGDADASKLDGTGLEKEQMGHTHVAFIRFGFGEAPLEATACTGCPEGRGGAVLCC